MWGFLVSVLGPLPLLLCAWRMYLDAHLAMFVTFGMSSFNLLRVLHQAK